MYDSAQSLVAIAGNKVVAVVEARMTSSRLPGKVLMPAGGKPLLLNLLDRLSRVSRLDEIVVATTVNDTDDPIVEAVTAAGFGVFRGSEDDVLQRVTDCLAAHEADLCVEVTGDCPLVDPALVDEMLDRFAATPGLDYLSNSDPHRAVPAGLDVQVFQVSSLRKLEEEAKTPADREHVTYGFYRPEAEGRWEIQFMTHEAARGSEHLWTTLDYPEDYTLLAAIYDDLGQRNPHFGVTELAEWIADHPQLHEPCAKLREAE